MKLNNNERSLNLVNVNLKRVKRQQEGKDDKMSNRERMRRSYNKKQKEINCICTEQITRSRA